MDILANGSTFLTANRPIQLLAELVNGHQYVSFVRHDLSLVEVANEDIQQMLNRRCGCCEQYFTCFRLSSKEEIDLWKSPI